MDHQLLTQKREKKKNLIIYFLTYRYVPTEQIHTKELFLDLCINIIQWQHNLHRSILKLGGTARLKPENLSTALVPWRSRCISIAQVLLEIEISARVL